MNKTQSNTTTRTYAISNTGSLELTPISCTSDKSFVTVTCPSKLKAGDSSSLNATFSIATQPVGQQTVSVTVKETDLEKILRISVNIVT